MEVFRIMVLGMDLLFLQEAFLQKIGNQLVKVMDLGF